MLFLYHANTGMLDRSVLPRLLFGALVDQVKSLSTGDYFTDGTQFTLHKEMTYGVYSQLMTVSHWGPNVR